MVALRGARMLLKVHLYRELTTSNASRKIYCVFTFPEKCLRASSYQKRANAKAAASHNVTEFSGNSFESDVIFAFVSRSLWTGPKRGLLQHRQDQTVTRGISNKCHYFQVTMFTLFPWYYKTATPQRNGARTNESIAVKSLSLPMIG